ncbi:hypothetical protein [Paenibacillus glucanolyticus]|uniref:hypothetical protein n=1 Tax=Paenibacillus glucanolyticus TaxID=59843 RepID=UPI00128C00CA|nr:hypothetical protein [Paenibacillus glucanolyticus]MPY15821.1 hypothetical protein [Paenibacillus glucanolyticus]
MKVNVTVKYTNHPDPQRLIDLWSNFVVKELLRQEQEKMQSSQASNYERGEMELNDDFARVSEAVV